MSGCGEQLWKRWVVGGSHGQSSLTGVINRRRHSVSWPLAIAWRPANGKRPCRNHHTLACLYEASVLAACFMPMSECCTVLTYDLWCAVSVLNTRFMPMRCCADMMTLAALAGVLFVRTVLEAEGNHCTAQASAGELSLHVEHPPFVPHTIS